MILVFMAGNTEEVAGNRELVSRKFESQLLHYWQPLKSILVISQGL